MPVLPPAVATLSAAIKGHSAAINDARGTLPPARLSSGLVAVVVVIIVVAMPIATIVVATIAVAIVAILVVVVVVVAVVVEVAIAEPGPLSCL